MTNRLQIAPSVLAADPLHIGREVKMMLEFGADLCTSTSWTGILSQRYIRAGMVKALKRVFPTLFMMCT